MKRLILEMGIGTDLYGGDYTKAACRAVRDAIGHSSISLFRSCGMNHRDMLVKVTTVSYTHLTLPTTVFV